jgi:hypothetical protein
VEKIKLPKPAIVEPVKIGAILDQHAVAPPATTAEEDRHAAGQRRINIIWELTQAGIALSVIWGTLASAIWITVYDVTNPEVDLLSGRLSNLAHAVEQAVERFYRLAQRVQERKELNVILKKAG